MRKHIKRVSSCQLPSIFARRKSFHAGSNRSIYQLLLGIIFKPRGELTNKGQHGVNPLQGFDEVMFVVVGYRTPSDCSCCITS
jgi:hypothetical protein